MRDRPDGASSRDRSSVGAYYPWLDALRGISWILVMIGHTTRFGYLARMGVGIFFAISGWLITKIILGSMESGKWSLTTFYMRRAIRIIPLYYVLIAAAVGSSLLFPGWKSYFEWLPPDVPEHSLLGKLIAFATESWRNGGGGFLIGQCWSLDVEERFYVFWPLLLALWPAARHARQVLIVGLIAVYAAVMGTLSNADATVSLWVVPFPLLFGCALAIFAPFRLQSVSKVVTLPAAVLAFAAYTTLAALAENRVGPALGTMGLLPGVLAAALTAAAIATAGESRNVVVRALQEAGKLSYAAYLFHVIFAFLGIKVARSLGMEWIGPIVGVAMIGPIAFAIHRYIETPFLNMRPSLERSSGWQRALSCLQVGPILFGLVFLFPWRDLLAKFAQYPALLAVAAVASLGAAVAAGVRSGHRVAVAAMDFAAAAGRAVHAVLRRSSFALNAVVAVSALALVIVAVFGGFRASMGPVLLSVRAVQPPLTILIVAGVARLIAAVAPGAPLAAATGPALPEPSSGARQEGGVG